MLTDIKKLWRAIWMDSKPKRAARHIAAIAALAFIAYGIFRGEMAVVLNKAVHICLECIGLG